MSTQKLLRPGPRATLLTEMARKWPTLPPDLKPIASNMIQILKNWDRCHEPKKLLAAQQAEFERRLAL